MLICGRRSIVDVTAEESVPAEDGPSVPVQFNVHVETFGFNATRTIRIEQRDARTFVAHLRAIERVRQATVTLAATPCEEFELRIGFIPGTGRAMVSGRLAATEAGENAPVLDFRFEFDPATLPTIVAEAERWIAPPRPSYYLCQFSALIDGMDEERAGQQFTLLGSILGKLGYQLTSGPGGRIDQLWAQRADTEDEIEDGRAAAVEAARPEDEAALAFERQFLAWLHIGLGILPKPRLGTNAHWWTFESDNVPVGFVIVGRTTNDARLATGVAWLLRVEEPEPCAFIEQVQRHFDPGSTVRRRLSDGRVRVQFKSTALWLPFVDQTDRT